MPIYEYKCRRCGHCFEDFRPAEEADTKTRCPNCGKKEIQRLMSAFCTGGGGSKETGDSSGCGASGPFR
jgi:putative FmdB family regulatory protein